MLNLTCPVHAKPNIANGYIQEIDGRRLYLRLWMDGQEFDATSSKYKVLKHQQAELTPGRYIAIVNTKRGKRLVLCSCVWSKEEIDAANARGKELFEKLQGLVE